MAVARLSRAERKLRTREDLLDAAYRVFTRRGFHGSSLDLVAAEAGYTKGAVYSNFASKEDLFLAVYERRVEEAVERMRAQLERMDGAALARRTLAERRRGDDGWLAVFFEFWAHVLRHPELRERFAAAHARARAPMVEASRALVAGTPVDAERFTLATMAMVSGLGLEQLTDPGADFAAIGGELLELLVRAIASMRPQEAG